MIDISSLVSALLEYGYPGLFLVSFLGSTIFIPLTVEIFLAGIIGVGLNPVYAVLIATIGSTFGSIVNYLIGRIGIKYYMKKVKKSKENDKWQKIADKYGSIGLLAVLALPLPLPVDILTIAAGVSRMKFKYFLIAVIFGKLLHYAFYAGIIEAVI